MDRLKAYGWQSSVYSVAILGEAAATTPFPDIFFHHHYSTIILCQQKYFGKIFCIFANCFNTISEMIFVDSYRHKGLRKRMVEELIDKGITDSKVLSAMNSVPRHLFLDSSFEDIAYENRALQIQCLQTISQPSTVAFQTQLLQISPRMKILEIGTGSGYQTAVLHRFNVILYTIERQKELYEQAKKMFALLKIRPQCFYGDGYKGLPGFAPFDRILVTCGAKEIPQELLKQLKTGGIMVIPVGDKTQTMLRLKKISENEFTKEEFGTYTFVPMLKNTSR